MRHLLVPLAAVLAVAPAFAADDEPEPTPRFVARCRKDDDRFRSGADKGAAVWKITSPSGISGATVELKTGPAPKKIVIRLVDFQSLEYFRLESGELKLSTQLNRGVVYFDDKGKVGADPKTAAGSLLVAREKDGIVVVLTHSKPGKEWTLSWIDAYRK